MERWKGEEEISKHSRRDDIELIVNEERKNHKTFTATKECAEVTKLKIQKENAKEENKKPYIL